MQSSQTIITTSLASTTDDSDIPFAYSSSIPSFRIQSNAYDDHKAYSFNVHVLTNDLPHSFDYDTHFDFGGASLKSPLTRPIHDRNIWKGFKSSNKERVADKTRHSRQRSLIVQPPPPCDEMSAVVDDPGSPPGLTASKSSKASTNRSSSSTSGDGILSDVSNFEDIGLEEEITMIAPKQPRQHSGLELSRRTTPRAIMTTASLPRSMANGPTVAPTRDLTAPASRSPRPIYGFAPPPSSPGHSNGPMRKFTRNASTPSLAIRAMSNYNRSRSPSPQSSPPMPRLSPRIKSPKASPLPPPSIPVRRGSWQPSGKTAKEREAECDEEDGEDLPEEASLWNVPISPRPPEERSMSLSPVPSPRISPGGSPERSSPLRTSVGADGVQYTAPKSANLPVCRQTLPANFHSASPPPHNKGTLPNGAAYQRSKSWNIALSELSHEAKLLTQSLEQHETEQAARRGSAGQLPPYNLDKLSRVKSEPLVQLPPLRTNNIMIDPLPISKEKERVLSRTRPSWLPPKSKQEERRHLAEYQKMMALSQAAERKRAARASETQCAKDTTKATLLRLWEEHVLPNWDEVIRDPRTRELWWRGIPPKCRGRAWAKALGNDLALTEASFQKALARAQALESSHQQQHYRREKSWFEAIARDTAYTFPELQIFQPGGPLHGSLTDVLKAYAVYRSDVGYSHGTHLLAAFLLLNIPTPSAAFIALANLLNRPLPLAFLTGDRAGEVKAYGLVVAGLRKKFPRLHDHLFGNYASSSSSPSTEKSSTNDENTPPPPTTPQQSKPSLHLPPHLILEPLLRTLFLSPGPHGLGLDTAARIWDVFVFDGDAAIIRACVATLGALESRLYGEREDVLRVLGWRGVLGVVGAGGGNEDAEEEFMGRVRVCGREMVRRRKGVGEK